MSRFAARRVGDIGVTILDQVAVSINRRDSDGTGRRSPREVTRKSHLILSDSEIVGILTHDISTFCDYHDSNII